MNRQVLPSMLLSVFIVCFFAVVLRPVEPPGGRAAERPPTAPPAGVAQVEARPAATPEAEAAPAPPPVAADGPAGATIAAPVDPPLAVAKPAAAAPHAAIPDEPPPPVKASSPEPAPVVHVAPRIVTPTPAPASQVDDRAEVRIASTPAPRRSQPPAPVPDPVPDPAPVPAPAEEAGPAEEVEVLTIPRGEPESTVAGEGETLEDVALRVYGTRAAVATLREANRGLAGRLRPGALLWTPPR